MFLVRCLNTHTCRAVILLVGVGLPNMNFVLGPPPPFADVALPELQNTNALNVHGVARNATVEPVRRRIAIVERAYVAMPRSPICVAELWSAEWSIVTATRKRLPHAWHATSTSAAAAS
jgi:hypothetical protein